MSFYNAGGRSNYFIEFGEGSPVILLHGISNSGRAWGPQIAPLVAEGFRVIVPDHAGHGASARLAAPCAVADLADDVEALLGQLDIDTFNLVGLSLGGMLALELALRHPTRMNRSLSPTALTRRLRRHSETWQKNGQASSNVRMARLNNWIGVGRA